MDLKMRKSMKRVLSVWLSLGLILSSSITSAYAEEMIIEDSLKENTDIDENSRCITNDTFEDVLNYDDLEIDSSILELKEEILADEVDDTEVESMNDNVEEDIIDISDSEEDINGYDSSLINKYHLRGDDYKYRNFEPVDHDYTWGGGYLYDQPNPPYSYWDCIDEWRYYKRQCTSFVAYRLSTVNKYDIPLWGNGDTWPTYARNAGYVVNNTPAIGAVACSGIHVAWVAAIDGDNVVIEEYNNKEVVGRWLFYSCRVVPKSSFIYIHVPGSYIPAPPVPKCPGLMKSGFARTIPNGDYNIVSKLDPEFGLDIKGYTEFGKIAAAQLFKNRDAGQDVFRVTWIDDGTGKGTGFYKIFHLQSGKALDLADYSLDYGAQIQACPDGNNNAQRFAISETADRGYYKIYCKPSTGVIDVGAGDEDKSDYTRRDVIQWGDNESNSAKWAFVPWAPTMGEKIQEGDYYIAYAKDTNKVLSIDRNVNINSEKYNNACLRTNKKTTDQVFTIKKNSDGSYYIKHKSTGWNLDIQKAGQTTNLGAWSGQSNGTPNGRHQKWTFHKNGNAYRIASQYVGQYIDLQRGNTADGTNIQLYQSTLYETQNGWKPDQDWILIPYVPVKGLSLDRSTVNLGVGGTVTLKMTANPSNASNKNVTWTSSNVNVATVNSSGVVTAKTVGTAKITVKSADSGVTAVCTINVGTPPSFSTATLAVGTLNTAYSSKISVNGSSGIMLSLASGKLPAGLSFNSGTGVISGTPTAIETTTFSLNARNAFGNTTKQFSIKINGIAPVIKTTGFDDATVGKDYSTVLTATGTAQINWSVTSGKLPDGLSLVGSSGKLSGVPTKPGIFKFDITAANAYGSAKQSFSINVVGVAPTISITELSAIKTGVEYTQAFSATGTAPITWKFVSGTLPEGIVFDEKNGVLHGNTLEGGEFSFSLRAENSVGADEREYTLIVEDSAPIITDRLDELTIVAQYGVDVSLGTVNNTKNVRWSIWSRNSIPGIQINSKTGRLTGKPYGTVETGVYEYEVTAKNQSGQDSYKLSIEVTKEDDGVIVEIDPNEDWEITLTEGKYCEKRFSVSSNIPLTYTIEGSFWMHDEEEITGGHHVLLPDGISFDESTGVISGVPVNIDKIGTGRFAKSMVISSERGVEWKGAIQVSLGLENQQPHINSEALDDWVLPCGIWGIEDQGLHYTYDLDVDTYKSEYGYEPCWWGYKSIYARNDEGNECRVDGWISFDESTGSPEYSIIGYGYPKPGLYYVHMKLFNMFGFDEKVLPLRVKGITPELDSFATEILISGEEYEHYFTVSDNGVKEVYYSIESGELPEGLSFSSYGRLSGTPVEAGTYNFTVKAENEYGYDLENACLVVYKPVNISTVSINGIEKSVDFKELLEADGTSPITWTVSGNVPDGISFDPKMGSFYGTPTVFGEYVVTVTAENKVSRDSKDIVIRIENESEIAVVPEINSDQEYEMHPGANEIMLAAIGTAPITWIIEEGELPEGLTLDEQTGIISGTAEECGDYSIVIRALNPAGSDIKRLNLVIKENTVSENGTGGTSETEIDPDIDEEKPEIRTGSDDDPLDILESDGIKEQDIVIPPIDVASSELVSGVITNSNGNVLFVGDVVRLAIEGVDPSTVRMKGKAGTYENGIIKAKSKGNLKLYVPVDDNGQIKYKKICQIKVVRPSIKKRLSLKTGKNKKMKIKNAKHMAIYWDSSDENVVNVNMAGEICAIKPGTAVITAKVRGYECKCEVKVK